MREEWLAMMMIESDDQELTDLDLCLNENCPQHRGGRVPHYLVVRFVYLLGRIGAPLYFASCIGRREGDPFPLTEYTKRGGKFAGPCGGINSLLLELEAYFKEKAEHDRRGMRR